MIKIAVMYPNQPGAAFDMNYYCDRHMALVRKLLGPVLKGLAVDEAVSHPQMPPPYVAIGYLFFDSVEACEAALAGHGPELQADIPNYTNVQPVFQISSARMAEEPSASQATG